MLDSELVDEDSLEKDDVVEEVQAQETQIDCEKEVEVEDEDEQDSGKPCCSGHLICLIVTVFLILSVCGATAGVLLTCKVKYKYDAMNGDVSDDFRRKSIDPRDNRITELRRLGLTSGDQVGIEWSFCDHSSYWNEEGYVELSQRAEQQLFTHAFEVHNMALEAVGEVINDPVLLYMFGIHESLWEPIRRSWSERQEDLHSRLDFSWSLRVGNDQSWQPRLIAFNGEAPTKHLETGELSKRWLLDKFSGSNVHQANYLDAAIKIVMTEIIERSCNVVNEKIRKLSILYMKGDNESEATMQYLAVLLKSVLPALEQLDKLKIGYDGKCQPHWQIGNSTSKCALYLYPKQWMITEVDNDGLLASDLSQLKSIEPWWKLIVSNKAMLPLLWSMYPNHPSLTPAYFSDPRSELGDDYKFSEDTVWVSSPLFSRDGTGTLRSDKFSSYDQFVSQTN